MWSVVWWILAAALVLPWMLPLISAIRLYRTFRIRLDSVAVASVDDLSDQERERLTAFAASAVPLNLDWLGVWRVAGTPVAAFRIVYSAPCGRATMELELVSSEGELEL